MNENKEERKEKKFFGRTLKKKDHNVEFQLNSFLTSSKHFLNVNSKTLSKNIMNVD